MLQANISLPSLKRCSPTSRASSIKESARRDAAISAVLRITSRSASAAAASNTAGRHVNGRIGFCGIVFTVKRRHLDVRWLIWVWFPVPKYSHSQGLPIWNHMSKNNEFAICDCGESLPRRVFSAPFHEVIVIRQELKQLNGHTGLSKGHRACAFNIIQKSTNAFNKESFCFNCPFNYNSRHLSIASSQRQAEQRQMTRHRRRQSLHRPPLHNKLDFFAAVESPRESCAASWVQRVQQQQAAQFAANHTKLR
jgi:hypothetical protein